MEPEDVVDPQGADPLRSQLLDAAARVFASKGYSGTKIMDIVKEAGLSSGAVYGRFASKEELLMEAVLAQIEKTAIDARFEGRSVGEVLVEATHAEGPLSDADAMRLEAFIAGRREPKVAAALGEARRRWRVERVEPLIQRAIADGSAPEGADFDSIVYFLETLQLGLALQRGTDQVPRDQEAWRRFMTRLFRAMAEPVDP